METLTIRTLSDEVGCDCESPLAAELASWDTEAREEERGADEPLMEEEGGGDCDGLVDVGR